LQDSELLVHETTATIKRFEKDTFPIIEAIDRLRHFLFFSN
jgi:hypothetical protein